MYVPPHFQQLDTAQLHALMRSSQLGNRRHRSADVPQSSSLPLLLDLDRGPQGTIVGHFARTNPQWRRIEARPRL
ncbi:MAG: FMN-binding negative transcriptional regulator [Planctomycetaceae bacterium]